MDTSDIVCSKENIQPLRHGRATTQLQAALQAQTDTGTQHALEMKRNEFELMLRNDEVEDPLSIWCDYVVWTEQSYLQQPKDGDLKKILRKCLNKFKNEEKYMNDPRFVRLCIKYADLDDNTLEKISQMYGHGIGKSCAEFYIAWAERLTLGEHFKQANVIYEAGVRRSVEPKEKLLAAQEHFHAFLVRRMLNEKELFQGTSLDVNVDAVALRRPYNVLGTKQLAAREVVPSVRVGENVLGVPGKMPAPALPGKAAKSNVAIKIFKDVDGVDGLTGKAEVKKFQSSQKLSKENLTKPGVWTDKSKKNVPFSVPATTTTPFKVHTDEDAGEAVSKTSKQPATTALKTKEDGYEDDGFATAPLFYTEPEDPTKRVMYCKHQVYAGVVEFQFEELRAAAYLKRRQERKEKQEKKKDNVAADVGGKASKRKERAFAVKEMPKPKEEEAPSQVDNNSTYANHTIHTKEALSEMQELWFAKPPTPVAAEQMVKKKILKPPKCEFQLYVDESCLGIIQPKVLDMSSAEAAAPAKSVKSAKFQVFEDEPEWQPAPNPAAAQDSPEDKENFVPSGYTGPVGKSTRRVTGVLTPSDNVPLDESSEEDDDKDDSDSEPDDHGVTENLTRAFQFPKLSSTPNCRKSLLQRPNNFDESVFVPEEDCRKVQTTTEEAAGTTEHNKVQQQQPAAYRNLHNLSAIAETSREYKSSSSGSSAASTFGHRYSTKNYPYTPSELRNESNRHKYSLTPLHFQSKGFSVTGYEASAEATAPTDGRRLPVLEETLHQSEADKSHEVNVKLDVSDPFADALIEQLLSVVKFREQAGECATFLDGEVLKAPKVGSVITLGSEQFNIKQCLGEGAYAKVYLLTRSADGKSAVAKYQKPAFQWELYITQQVQARLQQVDLLPYFMSVERAYFYNNASVLLTPPVEYGDLLAVINALKTTSIKTQNLAMYFTIQILEIVEALHATQIIHADVKPDNFLVLERNNQPRLQLIDFGRSIDMKLLPQGTTFNQVVKTEDFTCVEMQSGRPWTYQIDLYGAANCGHCLLFGDYMKVAQKKGVWNITKSIPRYFAVTEWKDFFNTLLNVESCEAMPSLTTLRENFVAALEPAQPDLRCRLNQLNTLLRNRS